MAQASLASIKPLRHQRSHRSAANLYDSNSLGLRDARVHGDGCGCPGNVGSLTECVDGSDEGAEFMGGENSVPVQVVEIEEPVRQLRRHPRSHQAHPGDQVLSRSLEAAQSSIAR